MLPSSQHIRLRHGGVKAEWATAALSLQVDDERNEQYVYSLAYESGRVMTWYVQSVFPYRILAWEEKVKSGFGESAQWLTTKATFRTSLKSAYWGKNSLADSDLRKQLGLD